MTVNEYQKLALSTMNPKLNRNDVLINRQWAFAAKPER